jgi:prepilin-type processing-associated H-X9-DG protein
MNYQAGCLWRYIGYDYNTRFSIMNCPTDLEDVRLVSSKNGAAPRNFSYSFDQYLLSSGPGSATSVNDGNGLSRPLRATDVIHPEHKILIVEEAWPNDSFARWDTNTQPPGPATFNSVDCPSMRHGGRSNQGFADGHVDCLYPVDLGYLNDCSAFWDPPGLTPGTTMMMYYDPLIP